MKNNPYYVNPAAETVLDNAIRICFIIMAFVSLIGIITGIVLLDSIGNISLLISLCSVFLFLVFLILWAQEKVIVNISRSLYNINDALRKDGEEGERSDSQNEIAGTASKFSAGQLVIVLADERQFRINDVKVQNGICKYHSDKFDTDFEESEIADFNQYWASKK